MIWVSIFGLVINLIAMKILHSSAGHSLNMRGAYLEVLNDMIGSAGVLVAAVIMIATGWYWVDAVVSGLIGLLILPRTWKLMRECIDILMEGTPGRIDLRTLRAELKAVPGVVDVHDLHVWTITSGMDTLSVHVQVDNTVSSTEVLEKIHTVLQEKFAIHHSTVQTELVDCKHHCDNTAIK
jgi:cobalt-zinc-cadmium efflux system protein